jgi:hypothetical protein
VDEDGEFFVVVAEGLELKESLTDLDEEIVIVVHLFDDFNDVGDELIPDAIVTED